LKVLRAVLLKRQVVRNVTPFRLVGMYWHFEWS